MPVFRSPERVRKSATESRNGGGGRLDEIQTTSRNRWGEMPKIETDDVQRTREK